jgi:hypothetical protein
MRSSGPEPELDLARRDLVDVIAGSPKAGSLPVYGAQSRGARVESG